MIFQNVERYCKKNGISISTFEKKCGLGNGTVGRWKNNESYPTVSSIEKIALATGISADNWIKEMEV